MNQKNGNDQLSTRIGADFLDNFNAYLSKNKFKKTQFIRDALTYWMAIDGKPDILQQDLLNAHKDIEHLRELLAEKERTISILQDQIQRLDGTQPHNIIHVGNYNSEVTASSGSDPAVKHQKTQK